MGSLDEKLVEVICDAKKKGIEYIVFGENHLDCNITALLDKLIGSKIVSSLYLECFDAGEIDPSFKVNKTPYNLIPDKYEKLVESAKNKNIRTFGITPRDINRWNCLVNSWARYISSSHTKKEPALILVGNLHVAFSKSRYTNGSINLVDNLIANGVPRENIMSICVINDDAIPIEKGIYKTESLQRIVPFYVGNLKISDYVILSSSIELSSGRKCPFMENFDVFLELATH